MPAPGTHKKALSGFVSTMRFLWLSFAVALAACSGDGVTLTREQATVAHVEIHLRYLGSLGAVETAVLAEPFPQDADGEAIRRVMSAARVEPRLRYVATRPANDLYGYRVVVAFGGWPIGGDSYCRNPALRPREASAEITEVQVVLCLGPSTLIETAGRTARMSSPEDPRFARLMTDLLTAFQTVASSSSDIESNP